MKPYHFSFCCDRDDLHRLLIDTCSAVCAADSGEVIEFDFGSLVVHAVVISDSVESEDENDD